MSPTETSTRTVPPPTRGRPLKWKPLLRLKQRAQKAITTPYLNEKSAAVTAAYFNRQMRERDPKAAEKYAFVAKGLRILCVRRAKIAV